MATESRPTFLKNVYLHTESNNMAHHTEEIAVDKLIVRRGKQFIATIRLNEAFNPFLNPLTITAQTGDKPSEDLGTKSSFNIPPGAGASSSAKVVWKGELHRYSPVRRGVLLVMITPPANCPIGKYKLLVKYKGEETDLADLVVLFNPWCPDDAVYLPFERKIKEYVLNEQGVIFRGSARSIMSLDWDFGQFEDDMVDICMKILDSNLHHKEDPARDVASRGDPGYVGRVISAMINSQDDQGILEGNWSGYYGDGRSPTHWSGSHPILSRWYKRGGTPVKYGQCWVFAGVMCSVMRLLGIPCRVITNFVSAHDVDRNLTIDTYYSAKGIEERPSPDSVWNFHVWVEGWFTRPDLSAHGDYGGWQVLDPTPQETSEGVYQCGPAPVKAIKKGETHLSYDLPFVFAEVNADCIDWLVFGEGENAIMKVFSDTKRVGQNISTKTVGSKHRRDVTDTYKFKEGTAKEREVFRYAMTRDYSLVEEWDEEDEEDTEDEMDTPVTVPVDLTPPPELTLGFEEETQPINGKDVKMKLVINSKSTDPREFTINISVQAMKYNGVPTVNIQSEKFIKTLLPGQELTVPIVIPYSVYGKHMVRSESMKIDAIVTEKDVPENTYLAECDVVLLDPDMKLEVSGEFKLFRKSSVDVIFENPVEETLTNCTLTVSGTGLLRDEFNCDLPNLRPNQRVRVKVFFVPYKRGEKTLLADFDCSHFRDIKASAAINVII
ncbi:protein-glutamine gamma-glutamyltransferase E [Salarias fasciatus]|uniref:protein-glutamine gamma-glutamyltransferase n=1 Tax=Salarias fasciatus TaxID=181472 RepID=A0A672HPA3_SALFA|nr:protein-glutamine gamma-glutamyltransferase E-like [Salarias fasciatus]